MISLQKLDIMLASDASPFEKEGWLYELKYDGYRLLASQDQLMTRARKNATDRYPKVVKALAELDSDFIVDGELCVLDETGVPRFDRLRPVPSKHSREHFTYFVFDILWWKGKDLRALPLLERKAHLKLLLPENSSHLGRVDHLEGNGVKMYDYALKIGMEGIVTKKADSRYVGGRSRNWLKWKPAGFHDGWKHRPGGE